ncbi:host-nuclease inhibitor Gam family protein [Ligilactobacillus sp. LYQ135]
MSEILEKQNEQFDERFVVDDPSKADWALRKLSDVRKQINEIKQRAEVEKKRILDWETTELQKLGESEEYFESLLNEFMNANLVDDPKFKFSSPYGKISVSHRKKWTHDDKQLIKKFEGTDFVTNTPKLRWGDLKKQMKVVNGKAVLKETGELVDGIVVDETETINIKTEG